MLDNLNFQEICKKHNLDPKNTSLHQAECAQFGLPINGTSPHQVECAKLGLDCNMSFREVELEKKRREEGI